MSGNDSRSDRDLLIRLEEQFKNMNSNVDGINKKLDEFNNRLNGVVRDIKDELKNDYVPKAQFERLADDVAELKEMVEKKFTPLARFEPVEEVHKDVSKRIRTLLITVGICVLIAAASAPTWLAVFKSGSQVQAMTGAK
jgi:archaellum component FlaC